MDEQGERKSTEPESSPSAPVGEEVPSEGKAGGNVDGGGGESGDSIPDPLAEERPDEEPGIPEEAKGLPGIPDDVPSKSD